MSVRLRLIRSDASIRARRRPPDRAERFVPAIVEPIVEPLETVVAPSIEALGRREWDSLFPNELDDWHYLRALERAQLERCEPVYFAIRGGGRLVAAAAAFVGRRALAEPWRARGGSQWRRAPQRALVLGSPFAGDARIGFAPSATAAQQPALVDRLLQAAREEAGRRGLEALAVSGGGVAVGNAWRPAQSFPLARAGGSTARISLPRWSLSDYLSSFEQSLRGRMLRICAQAAPYRRDWHVDLDRDVEPMLALCREAGLDEINEAFFAALLANAASTSALRVRGRDGELAGFSIVLHDTRALREKLTVVSRREKGSLVRGVIWLETLRLCLERGIGTCESASELSLSAAHPNEIVRR